VEPPTWAKAPSLAADLDRAFSPEEERTLSEDWVVRYRNRLLQAENNGGHCPSAGSKATVCEYRDRSTHLFAREKELRCDHCDSLAQNGTVLTR